MYQKEIIYMHLFEGEIRGSCLGYLKTEKKQGRYCLEIQVKKLFTELSGSFPIRLQSESGWREADMLLVREGNGKWTGETEEQILRAEIILSMTKKIKGESKILKEAEERKEAVLETEEPLRAVQFEKNMESKGNMQSEEKLQFKGNESIQYGESTWSRDNVHSEGDKRFEEREESGRDMRPEKGEESERDMRPEKGEESGRSIRPEEREQSGSEMRPEEREQSESIMWSEEGKRYERGIQSEEKAPSVGGTRSEERERLGRKESETNIYDGRYTNIHEKRQKVEAMERQYAPKSAARKERMGKTEYVPLYENKWEQLMSTYEQIHPYGDNRIYVKLAPKDFVILRENYQHLVNNSFLLHGFYNYRYLILGKENGFYLGVPGVFYEREKMVALMFGFEAFECEGGGAEEGKFGYYLRKVEL